MTEVRFDRRRRLPPDAYANREHRFHLVLRAWPDTTPCVRGVGNMVWEAVMGERTRDAVSLRAACLMPDHIHLLVRPATKDIVSWVRDFKSFTTHRAKPRHARLWQPGFWDRRIRSELEFGATLEYIRRNPEEAGLVASEEDWPGLWFGKDVA